MSGIHKDKSKSDPLCRPLPDDLDTLFSEEAINWLTQYGITVEELLKNNVRFSVKYNQIIYSWYDESNNLLAWQARNFTKGRTKYFTSGDVNDLLPIYSAGDNRSIPDTIVVVEDVVSALKIARCCDSMPALGSGISLLKLARLKGFYSRLIVWLDGNMLNNAIKLCGQAALVGMDAHPVYTELDPKEYSNTDINKYLQKVLDK